MYPNKSYKAAVSPLAAASKIFTISSLVYPAVVSISYKASLAS
jgi:hypothetical protein